jgi:hypothetical protein
MLGQRLRSLPALLAIAAIAVGGLAAPSASAYVVHIGVTKSPSAKPIPASFLGLGLEYSTIPQWTGGGSGSVNPVLVQLIRNLDPAGRPSIRIGGQSTDHSWWPVPGMRRPLGITYDLGPRWVASTRALAAALDAKLLLGVNLAANSTRIDQVEAKNLVDGIGDKYVQALQIGNEPLLYTSVPWYRLLNGQVVPWYTLGGTPVYARPPGYGPSQFIAEFNRTLRVLPPLPVTGPEGAGPGFLGAFARLLGPHSRIRMLTSHGYGLNQCITDPAIARYPSVPHMVSLPASRLLLAGVGRFIGVAHSHGDAYRIDEMGSVTCNGRAGVSNAMASALWVMDALFDVAVRGVDGVNLHSFPDSVNGLFDFTRTHGGWRAMVHPLYYGALMFARAAPAGSTPLHVYGAPGGRLRAWATLGSHHRVRVLLINDDLSSRAVALVHAPVGFGSHPGTVERLLASSAYATGGISIGGRGFGPAATSGLLRAAVLRRVNRNKATYSLSLPPASAALLTLH